jgi:hypothetical protein
MKHQILETIFPRHYDKGHDHGQGYDHSQGQGHGNDHDDHVAAYSGAINNNVSNLKINQTKTNKAFKKGMMLHNDVQKVDLKKNTY